MKTLILAAFALLAASVPASAVSVVPCNQDLATASAWNLVEPWEKNSRTFYNGAVRVALIDTGGEPVCCSMHLLIVSPSKGEGEVQTACHLVGNEGLMGFVSIDFAALTARYDAGKGLLIAVPYALYSDDGGPQPHGVAHVRVNAATGTVTAEGR